MRFVRARLGGKEQRAVVAAFFAFLLAFGQLAPLLHALLVEHSTCAEHGELVEVKDHDGHAAPVTERSAPTGRDAVGAGRELPPSGDHLHDHCELALHGAPPALVAATSPALAALRASTERPFAVSSLRTPHSVLGLAPKTSPPTS